MKKQEFIQEVTRLAKENGAKISQEDVKRVMAAQEEVIGQVVAAEDEVSFAGIKVGTRNQAARSGVSKMKDVETHWETPEMRIPTIKFLKSKKDELSVVL